MVTIKERVTVYIQNKLLTHTLLFVSKILEVSLWGAGIVLALGLLGYDFTFNNFVSCVAVYFLCQEVAPFMLQLRGVKR